MKLGQGLGLGLVRGRITLDLRSGLGPNLGLDLGFGKGPVHGQDLNFVWRVRVPILIKLHRSGTISRPVWVWVLVSMAPTIIISQLLTGHGARSDFRFGPCLEFGL